MEFSDIKKLARAAAVKTPLQYSATESYSVDQLNEVLRAELNKLVPDYKAFRRHQTEVFELIEETIDEVLPRKVEEQYAQFAETRVVSQGDKAVFKLKVTEASKKRAKTFVTKVGLAGRYETFKLDGKELTVEMSAIGGAARIEFEEFLDGRWDFADFTDLLVEGMDEYIYKEIAKALEGAMEDLPAANKVVSDKFDEKLMDELLAIADSYYNGAPATIICTREFASQMIPAEGWISNEMKNKMWEDGILGNYKGHVVALLAQSVEDETNEVKVIDPSNAYIIPTGASKPVKIAFEGDTQVRMVEDNDDWSRDMQTYKKFGVAVFTNPSICHYKNTSLTTATH